MKEILKIATRKSPLALWQAKYVKNLLKKFHPNLKIKLIPIVTKGDRLDKIFSYNKDLFVKELEIAILEKKADIAVHSIKDMSTNKYNENLGLVTFCKRDNPFDAFISNKYTSFKNLPKNAIIGTSSKRRICQIKAIRPDLYIKSLRGNINTRLKKLDNHEYDAIILAVAGLTRLGLQNRICKVISENVLLPAIGQGAIGVECNLSNHYIRELLSYINDYETELQVKAERAMYHRISGGCTLPIAAYAILEKNTIWIRGLVGSLDGKNIIKEESRGSFHDVEKVGKILAEKLLKKGAKKILSQLK